MDDDIVFAKIDMSLNPPSVVNTQVVLDESLLDPSFTWVDITDAPIRPGIGWEYDDGNFIGPPPPPPEE